MSRSKPASMTSLLRFYRFLASLKLAVILLLALAAVLALATWYESLYDARTAYHLVYGSWWFGLLLFLLGVNVCCSALVRYPWKKHQAGFVVTHLGIIVILVGALVTLATGLEGMMTLPEGKASSVITVDRPSLSYQVTEASSQGSQPDPGAARTLSAEFRWNPPREGREVRVPLANGMALVVDRYIHSALPVARFKASDKGEPSVQFRLSNGQTTVDEWVSLGDPERRRLELGPAVVTIRRAETEAALREALSPSTRRLDLASGVLVFDLPVGQRTMAVAGNVGREVPLEGTPYRIHVDRYLPHAVVVDNKLVNRSDERVNPCVEFTVRDGQGDVEKHLEFARFPQFSTTHHASARAVHLKVSYSFEDPAGKGDQVEFIVGPHDRLHYRITGQGGKALVGAAQVGRMVPTGWKMGMVLTPLQFLPRAEGYREFEPFKVARGKEGPPPAIRFRVEGADDPGPYWLGQGDETRIVSGKQLLRLRYHLQDVDIGFRLQLVKFEVGFDPGTRSPASYTSNVRVEDPGAGASFDSVITMNEPLYYKGLSFFQASYQEGQPMVSILQVARDPGTPVKYAGSIMLVVGIAMMFFFKRPGQEEDDDEGGPGRDEGPSSEPRPARRKAPRPELSSKR